MGKFCPCPFECLGGIISLSCSLEEQEWRFTFVKIKKAVYKTAVLHWEKYQYTYRNFSNQQYITKLVAKQNMFY